MDDIPKAYAQAAAHMLHLHYILEVGRMPRHCHYTVRPCHNLGGVARTVKPHTPCHRTPSTCLDTCPVAAFRSHWGNLVVEVLEPNGVEAHGSAAGNHIH